MSKQALKRVRRAIGLPVNRDPLPSYAWPGGYPLVYLFTDGGCICPECANKEIALIDSDMREARSYGPRCGGWAIHGVEANYENNNLNCDHCGEPIECAYPPDARDSNGRKVTEKQRYGS